LAQQSLLVNCRIELGGGGGGAATEVISRARKRVMLDIVSDGAPSERRGRRPTRGEAQLAADRRGTAAMRRRGGAKTAASAANKMCTNGTREPRRSARTSTAPQLTSTTTATDRLTPADPPQSSAPTTTAIGC